MPRPSPRRTVGIATCGLLFASVTACGGQDSLSAEEYRAEANERCAAGTERVNEMTDAIVAELEGEGEPDAAELADAMRPVLEEIRRQIADVRELDGPDDLEEDVHEALDAADDVVDESERRLEDDPASMFEGEDPFAEVNERLVDLGLDECGAA